MKQEGKSELKYKPRAIMNRRARRRKAALDKKNRKKMNREIRKGIAALPPAPVEKSRDECSQ